MPATADLRFAFNRGELGKTSLGRVDREAFRLAAETQENFMPLPQGPMMLRPGTAFVGTTNSNLPTKLVPFVFSLTDTALLEMTNQTMRVWVDDALVTRVSVNTSIKNDTFAASGGWKLTASDGATATISGGQLSLAATARGSKATAEQTIPVASVDRGKEHAVRVVVTSGPIYFKIGSAEGRDDLVHRTQLGPGTHSLAFTPTTAHITLAFKNLDRPVKTVTSCSIEAAGVLELPTIWTSSYLGSLSYVQSADIVYIASGLKPQKIERRSTTSWSVVDYQALGGPMRLPKPREKEIKLKANDYEGNVQLIASEALFQSGHVGAVFRVFPGGQVNKADLSGVNAWSDPLRCNGAANDRDFNINVSGAWHGTLTVQHSLDGPDRGFVDTTLQGFDSTITHNNTYQLRDKDTYSNTVVWYRVGFKDGDYRSGTATVSFGGGLTRGGIGSGATGGNAAFCRVTQVVSPTVAKVETLPLFADLVSTAFSSIEFTDDWMIQEWNGEDGYPTAVTLFDGRLWWAGKDRVWGSVSDDYEDFDTDFQGDAGPISRSLGTGPVDTITWLLPLSRLLVGRGTAVSSVRSSNFDEPLTPTNFTIKDASTRGAYDVMPGVVDSRGVYIHANGQQMYEMVYRVEAQDYAPVDLTQFNLDIGLPVFSRMAVAHSPDTRIFVVREDGQLAVLLREQDGQDQLMAWWRITMTGTIEDVAVLPNSLEDKVYVVVHRNGQRNLEVFARRDECRGAPETKCLDAHVVYSGSPTTTITGLDHLDGMLVRVWGSATVSADTGQDLGQFRVASGQIKHLPVSVRVAVVGVPYTATFLSAKLAYGAGLSIGQLKHLDQIAFVLFYAHAQGLKYGQDPDHLQPMPLVEDGTTVDPDKVWTEYDKRIGSMPGRWDTDARLSLQAQSPRPVTVGALILSVDTSARTN